MIRTITIATALLALGLAGCIAPPAPPEDLERAAVLPPAEPGGTMTREERQDTTRTELCLANTSLRFPEPQPYCARRHVVVGGDLTLTSLPAAISSGVGDVVVEAGEDDAWTLEAVIVASGATERDAADRAASIAVVSDIGVAGAHALRVELETPQELSFTRVTLTLRLPETTLYDLSVDAGSGDVRLAGLRTTATNVDSGSGDVEIGDGWLAEALEADTGSGDIEADVAARIVSLSTGSGDVEARIEPTGTGTLAVTTGSGDIELALPEGPQRGYDLVATTGSGDIEFHLKDGDVRSSGEHESSFVTRSLSTRAIRTTGTLSTGSGDVAVTSA